MQTAGRILTQRTYFAFVLYSGSLVTAPLELIHILRLVDNSDQTQTSVSRASDSSTDEDEDKESSEQIAVAGKSLVQILTDIARYHGFWSLWKAHFAGFIKEASHALLLNPWIEQIVSDVLQLGRNGHFETWRIVATGILSNTITGAVLSPLDLVRTRILVQSAATPDSKFYKTTGEAIYEVIQEAGSIKGLYPRNRIGPQILLHFVQSVFEFTPTFLQLALGLDPEDFPVRYHLAQFALGLVELVIKFPLETIVRRMECQVNNRKQHLGRVFVPLVEVDEVPYTNGMDCAQRLISSEAKRTRKVIGDVSNFRVFYRGFGLHLAWHSAYSLMRLIVVL